MSWEEVQNAERDAVVLIPTASYRQHGPHLPLTTDHCIITALVESLEKEHPKEILLLPTLTLGASEAHCTFSGTISFEPETTLTVLKETILSLIEHQFRKFYVLSSSSAESELCTIGLRDLKKNNPNISLCSNFLSNLASTHLEKALIGPLKKVGHACEFETSLMLHLYPSNVRKDKIKDEFLASQPSIAGLVINHNEISEYGVLGYPSFARPETGKLFFEDMHKALRKDFLAFHEGYIFSTP